MSTIHPAFAQALHDALPILTRDSGKVQPQPVATIRDCECCNAFDALASALQPHVVIAEREYDGYFDVDVGFVARQVSEVAESRVWVKFADCAAIPAVVGGDISGLEWQAGLGNVIWQPDGWLAEYLIGGAN